MQPIDTHKQATENNIKPNHHKVLWLVWVLFFITLTLLTTGFFWLKSIISNTPAPVKTTMAPTQANSLVISYQQAVKSASPSVVNIYTTQKIQRAPEMNLFNDPLFQRFFGQPQQPQQQEEATSLGSGVIVTADGYILTNNHVVAQADEIVVSTNGGIKAKAQVIGTDPETDLAVIKIQHTHLPTIPFKTQGNQVGDVVLAIGNPFGVGQTVTQGIISAIDRSGLGINTYEDFVQTDAAINPGNSGGALVDSAGQLVGINTAIYSKSGGSMGIGFAIPAKLAQTIMQSIIKSGHVTRGWLGVEISDSNNPMQMTESVGQPGVLIQGVFEGGPADVAGVKAQDRIVEINQKVVNSAKDLMAEVASISPRTTVEIVVVRNTQRLKLTLTILERPTTANNAETAIPPSPLFQRN